MRTISRYMIAEITGVFAVVLTILTLIFFIQRIIVITEWAINRGVGFMDILRLAVYLLPIMLMILIPVVTLFAILLTVGRLSSDSEITVLKAAGVGLHQLALPVILFSALACMLGLYTTLFLLPEAKKKTRELQYDIVKTRAQSALPVRTLVEFMPDVLFYIQDKDKDRLRNVLIFQDLDDDDGGPIPQGTRLVAAESARFVHDQERLENFLLLENGTFYIHDLEGHRDHTIEFERCLARLELEAMGSPTDPKGEAKESKLPDLIMRIREMRNEKSSGNLPDKKLRKLGEAVRIFRLELHERLAFPIGSFMLALWALPLGLQNPRTSRLRPIILSMVVSMLFYYLMILGKALALKGMISPPTALWVPNLVFLLIGIYLFELKRLEKPIPVLNWLEEWIFQIQEKRRKRREGQAGEDA